MTEDMIKDTLQKHLSEMKGIVQWAISFAFVATVLAVQGQSEVNVLNLKLSRQEAFVLISIVYITLCGAVLAHLRRVWGLFSVIPDAHVKRGFEYLENHEWLLNPFAFYLSSRVSRFSGYWGFTGLIVTFWLGFSGLYALAPLMSFKNPLVELWGKSFFSLASWIKIGESMLYMLPIGAFVSIGYLAMEQVSAICDVARKQVSKFDSDLAAEFDQINKGIKNAAEIGIGIGGIIFFVVFLLAHFWGKAA